MNLSTRLAHDFAAVVRQRGQGYYWKGLVHVDHATDSEVEARVRGSRTYDVSLAWQGGVLSAWCDCRYFDSSGACKHLWATILAAEALGYLSQAASATYLLLDYGDHNLDEEFDEESSASRLFPGLGVHKLLPSKPPGWRKQVTELSGHHRPVARAPDGWPSRREILYVVDVPSSLASAGLVLSLESRVRKVDGSWTRPTTLVLKRDQIAQLPLAEDRELLSALAGGMSYHKWGYTGFYEPLSMSCLVPHSLAGIVVPLAARTGRGYLRLARNSDGLAPLAWDEGGCWQFGLEVRRGDRGGWVVAGVFRRGEERLDLSAPVLVTPGGFVFTPERVAPLAEDASFEWMSHLRKAGSIEAPEEDQDELLAALLGSPTLPPLVVPEEMHYEEVKLEPRSCLRIRGADPSWRGAGRLRADLSFDYDGRLVPDLEPSRGWYEAARRRFLRRDPGAEKAAADLLSELGARFEAPTAREPEPAWELSSTRLPRIVRALVEAGWHIEAEGKIFRRPGAFRIEVSTGVDWFELHGEVEYGENKAQLPELLEALRRGETMVRLDDGTYGVLPEEWLRRFGPLAGLGTLENDHIRFRRSQAGLLDALLAAQPEARCDETFARVREELSPFRGRSSPPHSPRASWGRLRDYQREGLGWMQFLRRFSFGGCLADDMGVGKTAQVLALLETRRELRAAGEAIGPSLVVVPQVARLQLEAGGGALHAAAARARSHRPRRAIGNSFADYDVILTTYGTLRRDALRLKDVEFDYRRARRGSGRQECEHRIGQGGAPAARRTPPGAQRHAGRKPPGRAVDPVRVSQSGHARRGQCVQARRRRSAQSRRRDPPAPGPCAAALHPAPHQGAGGRELPPKTEQTVYCEMEAAQRKLYDELRQHYRNSLLKRIETEGLAKSKIQVLEALLRLRQAACHPGLLDPRRFGEPSAKLDVLLEQLREIVDEGHKALVFSQFTSLLRIVRDRLDEQRHRLRVPGRRDRKRQARVERFQNDAECRLFLSA